MSAHLRPDEHYALMSVFAERSPALVRVQLFCPVLGELLNVEAGFHLKRSGYEPFSET